PGTSPHRCPLECLPLVSAAMLTRRDVLPVPCGIVCEPTQAVGRAEGKFVALPHEPRVFVTGRDLHATDWVHESFCSDSTVSHLKYLDRIRNAFEFACAQPQVLDAEVFAGSVSHHCADEHLVPSRL